MFLEEICKVDALEGIEQECKAKLDRNSPEGWLKTVAGFANAHGGVLFVGVEDNTNQLIGFLRKEADGERNYFNNKVNEHLFPRPAYSIHFLKYVIHEQERYVLKVDVKESLVKPVLLKIHQTATTYIRREGFAGMATYEEIRRMILETNPVQYDLLPSSETWNTGHFQKLYSFCTDHGGKPLTEKALRSCGFMDADGRLRNGAVLFQDGYDGAKTAVQCSVFSGFTRGSERIVTINRYQGCLTDTLSFMLEFVRTRMNHSIIKLQDSRVDIDAYPQRALFEGLVNAVAHRDYYLDGTQIQVDMFRDRLEISSPGGFYEGEDLGKTYDLSHIISHQRNELICHVLVACNVMEAAGTGFDKILEEYKNADDAHRPYVYSKTDHFTLILPDLTYQGGVADDGVLPEVRFVPVPDGSPYDAKVLAYCYATARGAKDIAAFLGISNSTYFRTRILQNLVGNGYLLSGKQGRSALYRTNRAMVNS